MAFGDFRGAVSSKSYIDAMMNKQFLDCRVSISTLKHTIYLCFHLLDSCSHSLSIVN